MADAVEDAEETKAPPEQSHEGTPDPETTDPVDRKSVV